MNRSAANIKERHNITLSPDTWKVLKALKRVQGRSISEILENAVWKLAQTEKYNPIYFKMMASVSPLDDKENQELTEALDSLTDEDLEVAEKYEI